MQINSFGEFCEVWTFVSRVSAVDMVNMAKHYTTGNNTQIGSGAHCSTSTQICQMNQRYIGSQEEGLPSALIRYGLV